MDTLDKHIKLAIFLMTNNGGASELLPLLKELKQRRENEKVLRDAMGEIANKNDLMGCRNIARNALQQIEVKA